MAKNNINLPGFKELDTVFAALGGGAFAQKKVDEILRKSMQPFIKRAKELSSNADVTGDTTKSIGIIANRKASSITGGPRRGNGFKGQTAHLQEYGTAPHTIKAKPGKVLAWSGGVAKQVEHPGTAAQPFIRPAYDETKDKMVEGVKRQCKEIIESKFKTVFK